MINQLTGLSSKFYVCHCQLGQFSGQTGSGARQVSLWIIFTNKFQSFGASSIFFGFCYCPRKVECNVAMFLII